MYASNKLELEKSDIKSCELIENIGCEEVIEEGPIRSFDLPENIVKISDLSLNTENNLVKITDLERKTEFDEIELIPRTEYHLTVFEDELIYFFSKIKINVTGYLDDYINGNKLTFAKSKGAVVFIKSFHINLIRSETKNKYYNPGLRRCIEGNLVETDSTPETNEDLVSQVTKMTDE